MRLRVCKKCNEKFEEKKNGAPNPKCPACGTRATKRMRKAGIKIELEKQNGPTLWQVMQTAKEKMLTGISEKE